MDWINNRGAITGLTIEVLSEQQMAEKFGERLSMMQPWTGLQVRPYPNGLPKNLWDC